MDKIRDLLDELWRALGGAMRPAPQPVPVPVRAPRPRR